MNSCKVNPDRISVVILSSGLSERMGRPKALLQWNHSVTFIEKVISEFALAGCSTIVCMINTLTEHYCLSLDVPPNVTFVVNRHPEWGRFYSVKTGLATLEPSGYCFVHNVDNPFVDQETINALISARTPDAWCSPVYRGRGGHPVLLPGYIMREITSTNNSDLTLSEILNRFPKTTVEMDNDAILKNINTPDDYTRYFGIRWKSPGGDSGLKF